MKTILVVDDKANVRRLLQEYLEEQGFKAVVAANGREAIYTARQEQPDLILLDLMMPEMDGFEFLRKYRQEKNTPVIIITAREEETDAVLGLELGADDYVIKPFRMRELVSRIKAVLRRVEGAPHAGRMIRVDQICLDEAARIVLVANQPVHLTPIEFDLLAILMNSRGRVFTREQLVENLLQSGFVGLDRTLNVHIRNLRVKVEPDPDQPKYIETVFGVGYRFRADL